MVWYGLLWLERTWKTSKVDFHMVWTQVRQLSILGTFQGGGGDLNDGSFDYSVSPGADFWLWNFNFEFILY